MGEWTRHGHVALPLVSDDHGVRAAAAATDATLLSDSSWPGYTDMPYRVMEGYLQMASEAAGQIGDPPGVILL